MEEILVGVVTLVLACWMIWALARSSESFHGTAKWIVRIALGEMIVAAVCDFCQLAPNHLEYTYFAIPIVLTLILALAVHHMSEYFSNRF